MDPIIGRVKEIKRLNNYVKSRKSEFIAVYGRRRVGKTFLIRKAFNDQFSFKLTGLANANKNQQLANLHASLIEYTGDTKWEKAPATDWMAGFRQISELIEQRPQQKKHIIFMDEMPWLDTHNSKFLTGLEHFWNSWASVREDIILIVCGSAASWILHNLINNKGGLHNRITDRIKLNPFNLSETELFLKSRNAVYNRYQTLQLYMSFGGIPYYLSFVDSSKSTDQNINDIHFREDSALSSEYHNLYTSLFKKADRHISIIEAISTKTKGLNRSDIIRLTKLTDGGGLTKLLKELEESNFIRRYHSFGKKRRDSLYQLVDLYSLFYLKLVRDATNEDYWINNIESPQYFSWSGYAFEMVCLHHVPQIKKALGISGIQTAVSSWHNESAQIDLVIDRKDQVINLCEMKFSLAPFKIDKNYDERLRNKVESFRETTKTKKALFLTTITSYGLAQNKYSGMVRNDLTMDVLFESN